MKEICVFPNFSASFLSRLVSRERTTQRERGENLFSVGAAKVDFPQNCNFFSHPPSRSFPPPVPPPMATRARYVSIFFVFLHFSGESAVSRLRVLLISSSSLRWWVFGSRSTPAEAKEIESTPPPKITSPLLSRSFFVGERDCFLGREEEEVTING